MQIYLNKKADRRLRAGHTWVYSNEIDTKRSPLKAFSPGDPVEVLAANGRSFGVGYVNPNTLICARLLSPDANQAIDREFLRQRLQQALALRQTCFDKPFYRLVYGDSDGLPGLVVDRFGAVLVLQVNTAGMARLEPLILELLDELLQPAAMVLRNDTSARQTEGLAPETRVASGSLPDSLEIEENGVRFRVDPLTGQKTGWFFDHRMNRLRLQSWASGRRVLDVFSYTGAWGLQAAHAGASGVLCLDSSGAALEQARDNAELNGLSIATLQADAFAGLRQLREAGERFDLIVLDPPALIKRRKDYEAGRQAYHQLASLAVPLLNPDGLLVSASCSLHLPRAELINTLTPAARPRRVQILEQGGQGPDHPIHPVIHETEYLKAVFSRVL